MGLFRVAPRSTLTSPKRKNSKLSAFTFMTTVISVGVGRKGSEGCERKLVAPIVICQNSNRIHALLEQFFIFAHFFADFLQRRELTEVKMTK